MQSVALSSLGYGAGCGGRDLSRCPCRGSALGLQPSFAALRGIIIVVAIPVYASSSASMEWHVMRVCITFRFWATVLIPTLQGQSPHGSMPGAPGPGLARNRHQLTRESDPKAATVASIVTRAGRAEQRQGRARRRGALGGAGGASRQRQGA